MDNMALLPLHPEVQASVTQCNGDLFESLGYKKIKVLGSGMTAVVTLAMPPGGTDLQALKIFSKDPQFGGYVNKVCFETEISLLSKIKHQNIVEMITAWECPNTYIIAMPYYPRGDLKSLLPDIREKEAGLIFIQLASAVRYLHLRHLAHRDIKTENILISSDGDAVLTDFGLALSVTSEYMFYTQFCGTEAYAAPELMNARVNSIINHYKCDMYSLGVVLWCMVMKSSPPLGQTNYLGYLPAQLESTPGSYRCILENLLCGSIENRWCSNILATELWDNWSHDEYELSHYFHVAPENQIPGDATTDMHSSSSGESMLTSDVSTSGSEQSATQVQDSANLMIQQPVMPAAYFWPAFGLSMPLAAQQTMVNIQPLVTTQTLATIQPFLTAQPCLAQQPLVTFQPLVATQPLPSPQPLVTIQPLVPTQLLQSPQPLVTIQPLVAPQPIITYQLPSVMIPALNTVPRLS